MSARAEGPTDLAMASASVSAIARGISAASRWAWSATALFCRFMVLPGLSHWLFHPSPDATAVRKGLGAPQEVTIS